MICQKSDKGRMCGAVMCSNPPQVWYCSPECASGSRLGATRVTVGSGPRASATAPGAPHSPPQVPSAPSSGPVASEGLPGPATGHLDATLARLTADNRALTDQVTRLQEDSRARLMLTRIRRILLLGDEVPDQEVVDEVDRMAKRAASWAPRSVY